MVRTWFRAFALAAGASVLAGCATDAPLPASRLLTVATAGDVMLVGFSKALGTTGSFELASVHGQPMTCEGRFRYTSLPRGTARFLGSNGETGEARIETTEGLSGEGFGHSSMGDVHIL